MIRKEINDMYNKIEETPFTIFTMDVDGDGLKPEINQMLFPNGCHMDPGTRIYCVTFAIRNYSRIFNDTIMNEVNKTFICKLPDKPRQFSKPFNIRIDGKYKEFAGVKAYHNKESMVDVNDLEVKYKTSIKLFQPDEYTEFLNTVARFIRFVSSNLATGTPNVIYSKGYYNKIENKLYNYDAMLLNKEFKKYGIYNYQTTTSEEIDTIGKEIPFDVRKSIKALNIPYEEWNREKLLVKNTNIPNEEYLNKGIEDNILDAMKLNEIISDKFLPYRKKFIEANKLRKMKKDF